MLATASAVSNKSSLVFDPGVVCLLPVSMKLWQANLSARKQSKNRRPSLDLDNNLSHYLVIFKINLFLKLIKLTNIPPSSPKYLE